MRRFKLKNGLTVLYKKTNTNSVTVHVMVKTGSSNESKEISGISHFIEHMLFEGTKTRANTQLISNEIEKLGAVFNAYTSDEMTCYHVQIMNKCFENALDILSDMVINSTFSQKHIEKEKKIILKEVDMIYDDPGFYQWHLFQGEIFKKHPTKNPVLGTKQSIKDMTRDKLLDYYNKYYVSKNIVVSIVGNVADIDSMVERYFGGVSNKKVPVIKHVKEPAQKYSLKEEKRKVLNSYWVLGYKTPPRKHIDSYALDIIESVLGRGQSGKIFNEIRNKQGLAYEIGVTHESKREVGIFAIYATTDKDQVQKGKNIILKELSNIQNLTEEELHEAKTSIEGKSAIEIDNTNNVAETISYWEYISKAEDADTYLLKIKDIKLSHVKKVAKKYFNDEYTMIELKPIS